MGKQRSHKSRIKLSRIQKFLFSPFIIDWNKQRHRNFLIVMIIGFAVRVFWHMNEHLFTSNPTVQSFIILGIHFVVATTFFILACLPKLKFLAELFTFLSFFLQLLVRHIDWVTGRDNPNDLFEQYSYTAILNTAVLMLAHLRPFYSILWIILITLSTFPVFATFPLPFDDPFAIPSHAIFFIPVLGLLLGDSVLRWRVAVRQHHTCQLIRKQYTVLERAKDRNQRSLRAMFPGLLLECLEQRKAFLHPYATAAYGSLSNWDHATERLTALEAVQLLNRIYDAWDQLIERYGLVRMRTAGASYMAAGNIPHETHDSVYRTLRFCLEALQAVRDIQTSLDPHRVGSLDPQFGIHNGLLMGGPVGTSSLAYDVFGDAPHIASLLHMRGDPYHVQLSAATFQDIESLSDEAPEITQFLSGLLFETLGLLDIRNHGPLQAYSVTCAGLRYDPPACSPQLSPPPPGSLPLGGPGPSPRALAQIPLDQISEARVQASTGPEEPDARAPGGEAEAAAAEGGEGAEPEEVPVPHRVPSQHSSVRSESLIAATPGHSASSPTGSTTSTSSGGALLLVPPPSESAKKRRPSFLRFRPPPLHVFTWRDFDEDDDSSSTHSAATRSSMRGSDLSRDSQGFTELTQQQAVPGEENSMLDSDFLSTLKRARLRAIARANRTPRASPKTHCDDPRPLTPAPEASEQPNPTQRPCDLKKQIKCFYWIEPHLQRRYYEEAFPGSLFFFRLSCVFAAIFGTALLFLQGFMLPSNLKLVSLTLNASALFITAGLFIATFFIPRLRPRGKRAYPLAGFNTLFLVLLSIAWYGTIGASLQGLDLTTNRGIVLDHFFLLIHCVWGIYIGSPFCPILSVMLKALALGISDAIYLLIRLVHHWNARTLVVTLVFGHCCLLASLATSLFFERTRRLSYLVNNRLVQRNEHLEKAQALHERLLRSTLPPRLLPRIYLHPRALAESLPDISALSVDISRFSQWIVQMPPHDILALLQRLFDRLEALCRGPNSTVDMVRTNGDSVLFVAGVLRQDPKHAQHILTFARKLLEELHRFNRAEKTSIRVRLGIGCGTATSAIVGTSRPNYDVFGPAVTQAKIMERSGPPQAIHFGEPLIQRIHAQAASFVAGPTIDGAKTYVLDIGCIK